MPQLGGAGDDLPLVSKGKNEWLQMSVDEAIDALPFGPLQLLVFLAACTSQLVISAFCELFIYVRPQLEAEFALDEEENGLLQAVGFWAQLFGFILSGVLLDQTGRKPMLVGAALTLASCFMLESFVQSYGTLLRLRFISGLAPGVLQSAVPVYLSEFLGTRSRGFYLSLFNLGYPVGCCVIVAFVATLRGAWRPSLLVVTYPAVLMFALFVYLPESPRYLALTGKTRQAIQVVQSLHRGTSVPCPEILSGKEGATAEKMGWGHVMHPDRQSTFYALAPSFAAVAFASVGLRNWLPVYIEPSRTHLFPYGSVLFMSFCDLVGCISGAWVMDWVGRPLLLFFGFFLSAASSGLILLVHTPWLQSALGGVQQLTQAWVWVTIGCLICELFPTNCRGFFSGLLWALATCFSIITPVVGGYLFDHGEARSAVLLYTAVYATGALWAWVKWQQAMALAPGPAIPAAAGGNPNAPQYGAVSA